MSLVGQFQPGPGESPTLFEISVLGSLITSVSQDIGYTSPLKDGTFHSPVSPSMHWGIRIYALARGKSATYWPPTDTTSSSSSVFPVGLPSSTNQAHLLSFRGSAKGRVYMGLAAGLIRPINFHGCKYCNFICLTTTVPLTGDCGNALLLYVQWHHSNTCGHHRY